MRAAIFGFLLLISRAVFAVCPAPALLLQPFLPAPVGAAKIALADFDGDGKLDYAVTSYASSEGEIFKIYRSNGDGTFITTGTYPGGKFAILARDLNGDGFVDVVASGTKGLVYLNRGDGTFGTGVPLPDAAYSSEIAPGDVNGDHITDLVLSGGVVYVLYGAGDGSFPTSEQVVIPGMVGIDRGWPGDFDHDGVDEIAAIYDYSPFNTARRALLVAKRRGTNNFTSLSALEISAGNKSIYAVDVNGDGTADAVTVNPGGKDVTVFVNDGTGSLGAGTTYSLNLGMGVEPTGITHADIDEDGDADLFFSSTMDTGVIWLRGNGDGTFVLQPKTMLNKASQNVALGDIDGDGHKDLLLPAGSGSVVLFKTSCPTRKTTITLTASPSPSLLKEWVRVTATLTADDGGPIAGRVDFRDEAGVFSVGDISPTAPWTAIGNYDSVAAGDHVFVADYKGSNDCMPSSATMTHTVISMPFGPPRNFYASGSSSSVSLSWLPVGEISGVQIWRMEKGTWGLLTTASGVTRYTDTAVKANAGYFYKLRAVTSAGAVSAFTAADPALTYFFSLPAAGAKIYAWDFEGLRYQVDQLRDSAGLAPFPYTDPYLAGVPIKAVHLTELRSGLTAARNAAGAASTSFGPIIAGESVIKASDLTEIESAMY